MFHNHGSVNRNFASVFDFVLRETGGPVCIASPDGGVDIEEVAKNTPEKVKTIPIDINDGLPKSTASEIAKFLEFKGESVQQVRID